MIALQCWTADKHTNITTYQGEISTGDGRGMLRFNLKWFGQEQFLFDSFTKGVPYTPAKVQIGELNVYLSLLHLSLWNQGS